MSAKRRGSTSPAVHLARTLSSQLPRQTDMPNVLLRHLPEADYRRVCRSLHRVDMSLRAVLQHPSSPITDVFFPGGGFCSILTVLRDDSMVEVATVGREGMIGMAALFGRRELSQSLTMVQGASDACYRMPIDAFHRELNRHGAFYGVLTHYAWAHLGFLMQSTACNTKHSARQRFARWLLLAHDRIGTNEFPLTQEFAALMLGVSRPMVSMVASVLQRGGLIAYRRGFVEILNRARLEEASCECYEATTTMLARVTGETIRLPLPTRVKRQRPRGINEV